MEQMPRVGERVRIGRLQGVVVRIMPIRRMVEIQLDSGVSMTVDVLCVQPVEATLTPEPGENHADSDRG